MSKETKEQTRHCGCCSGIGITQCKGCGGTGKGKKPHQPSEKQKITKLYQDRRIDLQGI